MSGSIATPGEVVRPESAEGCASELARARAGHRRVLPAGHGSRLEAAGIARDAELVVTTVALGRILQYEPGDLTVTVEAGCPLAELDGVLGERGQVLPLQPGRPRGTVGGLVAATPEGATALAHGSARNWLTGLRAALADGTIVKGGGRVVKNVAGYGIHRLMTGSRGTLGVIVEASFKVLPRPEAAGSVVFGFGSEESATEAARCVLGGGLEPVFVNVLTDEDGSRLAIGFEGSAVRVRAHVNAVGDLVSPAGPQGRVLLDENDDARLRRALDDWTDPGAALPWTEKTLIRGKLPGDSARLAAQHAAPAARAVVRIATLPTRCSDAARRARQAAMEAGARVLADVRPGVGSAFLVVDAVEGREGARALGAALAAALATARTTGSAVVLAAPREVAARVDVWGPPPHDYFLMKRIKAAFDPDGVFASGGFVGDL